MSLGFARDSMLNLADLAKNVDDGEFKASFEYDVDDDGSEQVIRLSTGKFVAEPPSLNGDTEENGTAVDSTRHRVDLLESRNADTYPQSPVHHEMKTEDPDTSIEDKDSVTSSIDSDAALSSARATASSQAASTPTSETQQNGTSNYGHYSGFKNSDYDYYEDYYTAYAGNGGAPTLLGNHNGQKKQSFWCCLFPWSGFDKMIEPSSVPGEESLATVATEAQQAARAASKDDDETSTGSDMFGEKLSEKDRQAVLARLRLAQPDTVTNGSPAPEPDSAEPQGKGLLNGVHIPVQDSEKPREPKGILKRPSKLVIHNHSLEQGSGSTPVRRSLFPAYAEKTQNTKDLALTFSTMARVLSVKSRKDMDEDEKGNVWWQKSDYEEFRKTGRMITKAMLAGGSEIWLATNRSWQLPNQARSTTLKHATSLAERQAAKKNGDKSAKVYESTRDKWWHKFGHSRRGLEHVASIDEGRQRQGNVRQAIRAVVEENRRQKAFLREDADKVRMVSLQHTAWAKDLALAAGASDADAVRMNFNDQSRKSREFYLLKFSRANQSKAAKSAASQSEKKTVPAFMRPSMNLTVKPNRLDANTASQIRYRQTKNKTSSRSSSIAVSSQKTPNTHSSSLSTSEHIKMAKKAAGFAKGEEIGNMSAVLSGMGPLPKSTATAGGP